MPEPLPTSDSAPVEFPADAALAWAHPVLREWFLHRFGSPTEPQIAGWPAILRGEPTLISAPTGSGKTLAAFFVCIDKLLRDAIAGRLSPHTQVVYLSPLKALSNDVQKNLDGPLAEIQQLAMARGYLCPEIRTAVRTGDTLPRRRAEMLKHPPHILVTTPESLYILLTAGKSRQNLARVQTVIVDEIHAVADDKRGAHLALSLERLDALVRGENHLAPGAMLTGLRTPPQRIGLSATQNPIELVAEFLTGSAPNRRPATIVQTGQRRALDLALEVPSAELTSITSTAMWEEIYDKLAALAEQHRSTLVFVNTRRLVEKLSFEISNRLGPTLGPDAVAAHHGSLSRALRLDAEQRLKSGEVRILIATASLELGIDIGTVDLVCQIATTRSIGVAMQRVGRAGHWRGATPKGRFFATTRDDLFEQAALLRKLAAGELDRLQIPESPIDVLMQQIVAAVGAESWEEAALFDVLRRAYPYRNLTREEYEEVLALLHNGIENSRGRYGAYILRDQVHGHLHARRGSRSIAISNGGAIPDTSIFAVMLQPENVQIATVDEHFAVESSPGDVILLGNTSWRIQRVDSSGKVLVEDAHGAPPSIPFWEGEAPQRTSVLSDGVSELRAEIDARTRNLSPRDLMVGPGPADTPALIGGCLSDGLGRVACETGGKGAFEVAETGQVSTEISPSAFPQGLKPTDSVACTARLKPRPFKASSFPPAAEASTDAAACMYGLKPVPFTLKPSPFEASSFSPAAEALEVGSPSSSGEDPRHQLRDAIAFLERECFLNASAAHQLIAYVVHGRAALGAVPTKDTLIAERFFDEGGGQQLILHAPFGGRLNKAWGLALRKRFCRGFNFELQAAATDNGINISLAEQHSFPLADVFHFLTTLTARGLLEQASIPSPLFKNRWRWAAGRSLQLLRMQKGRRVAPQIQRTRSDDLLASVFPHASACPETMTGDIEIPDHPLVREVMKDTLTEGMDIDGLLEVLEGIEAGTIRCLAIDTPVPSVFAHELIHAMPYAFLDPEDAAARRARAVRTRGNLPSNLPETPGRLDPAAIAAVRSQLWPDLRDEHELHDLLLQLIALPTAFLQHAPAGKQSAAQHWPLFFDRLVQQGRAHGIALGEGQAWIATERRAEAALLWPEAERSSEAEGSGSSNRAVLALTQGWLQVLGPTTAEDLAQRTQLAPASIFQALLTMEMQGLVLRGVFAYPTAADAPHRIEWCERRILQRIHRLTLGTRRKQVEPVTPAVFLRWLLDFHHIAPQSQLSGEEGVLAAIEQMEGFEAPAIEWERTLLPARVANYDPRWLDNLCLAGVLGWGRISPHPAWLKTSSDTSSSRSSDRSGPDLTGSAGTGNLEVEENGLASVEVPPTAFPQGLKPTDPVACTARLKPRPFKASSLPAACLAPEGRPRRVIPTCAAPITFYLRESSEWLHHALASKSIEEAVLVQSLSSEAQTIRALLSTHGAAFTADLQRLSGLTKLQTTTALWELAAAGLASADGFDQLRAMMDPRRKSAAIAQTSATSLRKRAAARTTAGRWSLFYQPTTDAVLSDGGGAARPSPTHGATATTQAATQAAIEAAKRSDAALDAHARILLCRYGVLFRELLAREANAPKWRDLLPILRRLEARGEIRGGRFVSGPFGEQYALPEAVEGLRGARNRHADRASEPAISVAAADPLNLAGILVPGERIAAIPGRSVRFLNGVTVEEEPTAGTLARPPRPVRPSGTRRIAAMLRTQAPVARTPQPVPEAARSPAPSPAPSPGLFS